MAALLICQLAFRSSVFASDPPAHQPLDNIIDAFKQQYASVSTIQTTYTRSLRPIADETVLTKYYGLPHESLVSPVKYEWVLSRDGRIREVLERAAGEERTIDVYDGQKLLHWSKTDTLITNNQRRDVYMRINPSRLESPRFLNCMLDFSLFAYELPGLTCDANYRAGRLATTLFANSAFTIDEKMDSVDGTECIVARSPGSRVIWFDRARNFAVKKQLLYREGQIGAEVVLNDFIEVCKGVWLPRHATETILGAKENDGEFLGKRLYQFEFDVKRLEVNRPESNADFTLKPPAGAWVVDETLKPRTTPKSTAEKTTNLIPAVSYIYPADESDLEEVIKHAELGDTSPRLNVQPVGIIHAFFWWATIGVIAVLLFFVIRRWMFTRAAT